jgi:metal-dependent hydrolase (beta-lactamase superfamily II)
MQLKIKFLGAAQNVTGSRHMLQANGTRLLVDCGLYQERQFKARNWEPFEVPPDSIDAVLLTHAHLDHCGLLPKLSKEGFKGKIYGCRKKMPSTSAKDTSGKVEKVLIRRSHFIPLPTLRRAVHCSRLSNTNSK